MGMPMPAIMRSLSTPLAEASKPWLGEPLYSPLQSPCPSDEGPEEGPTTQERLQRRVQRMGSNSRFWDSGEFESLKAGRWPEDVWLEAPARGSIQAPLVTAAWQSAMSRRPRRLCLPPHTATSSSSCSSQGSVSRLQFSRSVSPASPE